MDAFKKHRLYNQIIIVNHYAFLVKTNSNLHETLGKSYINSKYIFFKRYSTNFIIMLITKK